MDTSYAMAKFGLESKDILKSKQKGCWHYMKYFFIFSSIIQFLIILGLVLFMLYGNAHGGTELRLKSVENRYKNLTIDHAWLKGNFSLLKEKLASTEKDAKNCSDTVLKMRVLFMSNMNKTVPCQRFMPISNCNNLQAALDHLNMSCSHERIKAEHAKILQEIKLNKIMENYTNLMNECANKDRLVSFENVQLKKDKKDLETQIKILQGSCTAIDEKFKLELQNLKNFIEESVKPGYPYDYQPVKCKPLTDTVNNRIDVALTRLRQDVNNVMYENSEVKVTNARINEDLGKCKQDKDIITGEKNNVSAEKTSLEKQLGEKKDELNKSYALYIKKIEEFEACRRLQMRPPVFPPLRT
ncbi:plasmalemma vesicle-associated protein [Mantella aurantiaca]